MGICSWLSTFRAQLLVVSASGGKCIDTGLQVFTATPGTVTVNGAVDANAVLASGRHVTAAASVSAAISGNLTNNGTVNGPTLPGLSLALLGDVNGTGKRVADKCAQ